MRFVDNGKAEDFALLCFKGMDVPICKCGLQYDIRRGDFVPEKEPIVVPSMSPEMEKLLAMPIEELELKTRSMNGLKRLGIKTVGELIQLTATDLLQCRSLGAGSVADIEEELSLYGLTLKQEEHEAEEA